MYKYFKIPNVGKQGDKPWQLYKMEHYVVIKYFHDVEIYESMSCAMRYKTPRTVRFQLCKNI